MLSLSITKPKNSEGREERMIPSNWASSGSLSALVLRWSLRHWLCSLDSLLTVSLVCRLQDKRTRGGEKMWRRWFDNSMWRPFSCSSLILIIRKHTEKWCVYHYEEKVLLILILILCATGFVSDRFWWSVILSLNRCRVCLMKDDDFWEWRERGGARLKERLWRLTPFSAWVVVLVKSNSLQPSLIERFSVPAVARTNILCTIY